MEVTDPDLLCGYLASMSDDGTDLGEPMERIRDEVRRVIELQGSFHITIAIGLLRAIKSR